MARRTKNVFDIQQGVAIALLRTADSQPVEATLNCADSWGLESGRWRNSRQARFNSSHYQ
jgi:hypothetical protein